MNKYSRSLKYSTLGLIFAMAPVLAQENTLEEVTVTAQKREQSLQDVNIAVSAVGGLTLERGLIDTIEDLQAIVPSLSAGNDFAFAKLFIRGIGLNNSFAGVDPSVAVHSDGAVISSSYAQLGAFFDLERIEVLRGPQGTLYGRNAVGGSVNLITRKPTEEFGGYGRVTVGNYELLMLEGAVSGPLSDNVQGRIAYKSTDRGGYGINELTGNDIDDANKRSIRGHLNWNINDDVSLLFSAELHREDDAGLGIKLIETLENLNPAWGPPGGKGGFSDDRRNTNSEKDNENDRESASFSATLDWRFSDQWSMTSITNFRNTDVLLVQDLDNSSNIGTSIQTNFSTFDQFSQELQFHYSGERLRGLVAAYYFDEDFTNNNNIGAALASSGLRTTNVLLTGDTNIKTAAIFANFSFDITDTFSVNAGGRYADERRKGDTSFSLFFLPSPTRTFEDDKSFTKFTPSLGVEWRPAEDRLLYFTYSEGFKGGGFHGGQLVPILDPELIDNYEFGFKGMFLESRLQANFAAFYYEITDMQLDRTVPTPNGGFATVFQNAASSEGKGAEMDLTWLIGDSFRLIGNLSYLDAEFVDYLASNPIDKTTELEQLAGNALRQAPKWQWYIRGEYEVPMSNGGSVTFGAEASQKAKQFYTEFNDEVSGQEAYTLLNVNIEYMSPGGQFSVNAWGKNITDEFVVSGAFVSSTGLIVSGNNLPPATWGVTFGYSF